METNKSNIVEVTNAVCRLMLLKKEIDSTFGEDSDISNKISDFLRFESKVPITYMPANAPGFYKEMKFNYESLLSRLFDHLEERANGNTTEKTLLN